MAEQFHRFSGPAKRALLLAQAEAKQYGHHYIGTEHLLLGLVSEETGQAGQILRALDIELTKLRHAVLQVIGRGTDEPARLAGLTPRAKRTIELAVDEARRLQHDSIGTGHLLLGLLRAGQGIATGILATWDLAPATVRQHVIEALAADTSGSAEPTGLG